MARESEESDIHRERRMRRGTKKERILALRESGITDLHELCDLTESKPSYVASVLQEAGLLTGYFDLYTHSASPRNIYSELFAGKVGFKNDEVVRQSLKLLDEFYSLFKAERDRAGQHQTLETALIMCDRARWSGKLLEAGMYRDWLVAKLSDREGPPKVTAPRGDRH